MANTTSGVKHLIMNTRERGISPDVNKAQQFAARSRAEIARLWYDTTHVNTSVASTETQHTAAGAAPLSALLFGGFNLLDLGNDLQVQAGSMACVLPDAVPDPEDSPYRLIEAAASPLGSVLLFQANGGPGSRVDLIEVQPLVVNGSPEIRDIRDILTNQFAPQAVLKESSTQLTYRIRQGTPGNGTPVPVADWLPLYAINTPSTAVDYSTCDIYDLRPELSERPDPSDTRMGFNSWSMNVEFAVVTDDPLGDANFNCATWGYGVPGNTLEAYNAPSRFGGNFFQANTPGPDGVALNLNDPRNQDATNPPAADALATIVAAFPQGLPRWQLCLRADRAQRHPCRGIVIVGNAGTNPVIPDGSGAGLTANVPDIGPGFYRMLGWSYGVQGGGGDLAAMNCSGAGLVATGARTGPGLGTPQLSETMAITGAGNPSASAELDLDSVGLLASIGTITEIHASLQIIFTTPSLGRMGVDVSFIRAGGGADEIAIVQRTAFAVHANTLSVLVPVVIPRNAIKANTGQILKVSINANEPAAAINSVELFGDMFRLDY